MEDAPYLPFPILKKNPSDTQLVGFHISLPMGYVDNAPYFCIAMETVPDLANEAIPQSEQAHKYLLEMAAEARAADASGAPESQADAR